MYPLIEAHRTALKILAERHGLAQVRVFGSMARGDADPASDVDLLVSPLPGTSLLALGGFAADAEALLGRHVEVVSERALHPLIRDRALAEAEAL
ncbi:MAG TPA: nucleotidyltransferase family protein [Candidatus Macondimonas sp.]|nr:nucleotidyltransferase family protein [Candidatus Macondimonas sp.]